MVFTCHRPLYVASDWADGYNSDVSMMNKLTKHLDPLLHRYKVNLAFYGHNHAVQRTAAVFNNSVFQHSTQRNASVNYNHAEYNITIATYHDPPVS